MILKGTYSILILIGLQNYLKGIFNNSLFKNLIKNNSFRYLLDESNAERRMNKVDSFG